MGITTALGDSRGAVPKEDATIHTDWRTFTTSDGLPHDSIRAIHVLGEQVWVGTDGGLALFEGDKWSAWTRDDGLPVSVIMAIDVDPETRDVWLGTWGGGLVRFSGGRFDLFDQLNSGLASDLIFDVAVVGSHVWAATSGGVSSYDASADTWELYHPKRAYAPESAVTALVAFGGDLYAGLWRGGVERFDSTAKRWEPILTHLSEDVGRDLPPNKLLARDYASGAVGIATGESLWWATQSAVLRLPGFGRSGDRPEEWQVWPIPRMVSNRRFVECVASPGSEKVWLGTRHGLYILADSAASTWVHLRRDNTATVHRPGGRVEKRLMSSTIPDDRIRCIAFDGDVAWVGTASGLARGENPRSLTALPLSKGDDAQTRSQLAAKTRTDGTSAPARGGPLDPAARMAVAIYGPRNRTIALEGQIRGVATEPGRPDQLAVEIAVEHANARGGYRGSRPFNIVMVSPGYARYGWGLPEDDIVIFSQDQRVMGIVGYLIPKQHIADAVVHRTEVPWMNVAPTAVESVGTAEANPWVFRCYGDEPRRHRRLLDNVIDRLGHERLALLRTPDRASTVRLDWWKSHAEKRNHPVVADLGWPHGPGARAKALAALRAAKPDVVVTWCDKTTTAEILREMRAARMNQPIVVSSACVAGDFVGLVGSDPGQLIALDPAASTPVAREQGGRGAARTNRSFANQYADRNVMRRSGVQPNLHAYRSFSATDHVLHAMNAAGGDREAVRKTLEAMSRSATGEAHYERLFDTVQTRFATLRHGEWTFHPLPTSREETSPEP